MHDPPSSFTQVVGTAVSLWRRNFLFYFAIAAISIIPQLMGMMAPDSPPALCLAIPFLGLLVTLLTQGAAAYFSVRQVSGPPVSGMEAFGAAMGRAVSLLWTGILVFFWIILGFILLIVPGVLWAFNYCLAPLVVMTEGLSGSAALARSKQLVNTDRNLAANIVVGLPLLLLICLIPLFSVEFTLMTRIGPVVAVVGQLVTALVFQICWIAMAVMFPGLVVRSQSTPAEEGVGFNRH